MVPAWAFAVPIALVGLAEASLFFGHPGYALSIHFLNLLFCVVAPIRHQRTLPLLQPFALLPLFRLVNLGMPRFFELTLLFFPFTYLSLLPALYLVVQSQEIEIGTDPKALLLIPAIVLIAGVLAIVEHAVLQPEALIPAPTPLWLITLGVIQIGTVGLVEEILFRGILQRRFTEYLGRSGGIALASVLFGLMHSIYGSGIEIIYVTFLGAVFGVVYEVTDSIGLTAVLHGVLNIYLFALIPFYRPDIGQELLAVVSGAV